MNALDSIASKEKDLEVDLENGTNAIISGQERPGSNESNHKTALWNGFCVLCNDKEISRLPDGFCSRLGNGESSGDRNVCEEEKVSLVENKVGIESLMDKALRKPTKPPRPPRSLSLDAANQNMVKEKSELAMIKRTRLERMKALRHMKNAKVVSSTSNLCALFMTILFCVIIIWHGMLSKHISVVKARGSPESTVS